MRVHFIAIGGSVMHNLALSLAAEGHAVTGSDDAIHEPSRSRLAAQGLLPAEMGWDPARITPDLNAVIVGMHARADNPELLQAQALGLPVYSFPEFVYAHSRNKQRVVIAGSHGKTTITSMVMHVLRGLGIDFDYLVGAQLEGFPHMVRLSKKAPVIIIEGDEYATSPLDPRPKFLVYQPHIVALSGIAWDHVNVFATEQAYVDCFRQLLAALPKAGCVVFNAEDERVVDLVTRLTDEELHYRYPYHTLPYRVKPQTRAAKVKARLGLPRKKTGDGPIEIKLEGLRKVVQVYGQHNMANIAAAYNVCKLFAITPQEFLAQIGSFKGAHLRLETVYEDERLLIIRDFAHSPSKVRATVQAVAERYRDDNLVAAVELHTFSSLNKQFLGQYQDALKAVSNKIVLVNAEAVAQKRMESITASDIHTAFHDPAIHFVENRAALTSAITSRLRAGQRNVVLLMSSGNLDNLQYEELAQEALKA